MNIRKTACFALHDNEWFVGNDPARGPWSADACHAGPVTGLIARALEQAVTDKQLVRITVNFVRPVTMHGFRIRTEITRAGKAATTAIATLEDKEGKIYASATSLHLIAMQFESMPTATIATPNRQEATPGEFAIAAARHGRPFFRDSVEVAYPPGEDNSPGPTTMWMRSWQLLANEAPSPFQRACPLADCGNGIARNAEIDRFGFVNPDLTVILHRLPESEWLASQSISFWEPTGIGLAQATLFDEKGPIGIASQSLLVHPVT